MWVVQRFNVDPRSNCRHKASMAKKKIIFKPVRIAEGDWNILAEGQGMEPVKITGFKTKSEIDEWMNGEARISWLRSQGYAK